MLVLTRKRNQHILVGDDILISIIDLSRDKVRLGIQAPSDVRIMRTEHLDIKTLERIGLSESDEQNRQILTNPRY